MKHWSVVPTIVKKSYILTPDEKDLYYELMDNLCAGGYCKLTNAELAKIKGISERSISYLISSMKDKKYISMTQNTHTHRRQIYLRIPGEGFEEEKPTEKDLDEKTKLFETSLKHAIVFGTIDFKVLIEKLFESPYLENLEDNSTQFCLTMDEIDFLEKFQRMYRNKAIDCQIALYRHVNLRMLLQKIQESKFLMFSDNLSLKWCLDNAENIIKGEYKTYSAPIEKTSNFKGRNYSKEFLFTQFQSIDDIEI